MSSNTTVNIKNSISTRLLKVVFSLYLLVAASVTGSHMFAEYLSAKNAIIQELQNYQKVFVGGLAESVWNIQQQSLKVSLEGMLTIPTISGIKIEDTSNYVMAVAGTFLNENGDAFQTTSAIDLLASGNFNDKEKLLDSVDNKIFIDLMRYKFKLYYALTDENLGWVTLYSNQKILIEKLKYVFLFILFNSIIKTSALWLIFLYTAKIMLSRPLKKLTNVAQSVDLDNLENLVVDVKTKGRNELKVLEEAFNDMIAKLLNARNSLEFANNRLNQLLITTKKMAVAGAGAQTVMTVALKSILQVYKFTDVRSIKIYNRQKVRDIYGYALYDVEAFFSASNNASELELNSVYNSFSAIAPKVIYQQNIGVESILINNTLYMPCFNDHNLLGLIEISGIKAEKFNAECKSYVDTLIQSLTIYLKNIEYHADFEVKIRMEEELKTAAVFQNALLPTKKPKTDNLEISTFFQAAWETCGDWYGYLSPNKDTLMLLIGDATGHGTPAALLTSAVSATCKMVEEIFSLGYEPPSPARLLKYINNTVCDVGAPQHLMTFFAASINLNTGEITYSNGGHNFPYLVKANGKVKSLLSASPILGISPYSVFTEEKAMIKKDEILFFYTDGAIENENRSGQMWGNRTLNRFLKANNSLSAKKLMETMVTEIFNFYDNQPIEDDITMLACKVTKDFQQT